jgi:hypothetical protein
VLSSTIPQPDTRPTVPGLGPQPFEMTLAPGKRPPVIAPRFANTATAACFFEEPDQSGPRWGGVPPGLEESWKDLRKAIKDVLLNPHDREWTIQGFGFGRCYFGAGDRWRLNIWHDKFAMPNVSIIHDHPWDFRSWIISGEFTNQIYRMGTNVYDGYVQSARPPTHHCQYLRTGIGGGLIGDCYDVFLHAEQPEYMKTAMTYKQGRKQIHASFPANGAVTLNDRRNRVGEDARVFWPLGTHWVSAHPRVASKDEVNMLATYALARWDGDCVG